jgi:hypothetical protein
MIYFGQHERRYQDGPGVRERSGSHRQGLLAAAGAARQAGALTLLHCEEPGLLERTGQQLIAQGRGAVANFPDARPVGAEVAAIDQAIGIARTARAPIYIVHLSSAAALERCRQARAGGLPVHVETRPLYLHLTRERFAQPDAAKYVGAPPLRDQADREALWVGLAAGDVDTVCSDHAPWTLADKLDPALNVITARQGVADLDITPAQAHAASIRMAGRQRASARCSGSSAVWQCPPCPFRPAAQNSRTSRPRIPPASSSRCASAARSAGRVRFTRSVSLPAATRSARPASLPCSCR